MRTRLLFLMATLPILAAPAAAAWPNGYQYRDTYTIRHTQISSDLTNFPVVIAGLNRRYGSVASGGYLRESHGYDFLVTSDPAGQTVLPYERIVWQNDGSGQLVVAVRLPLVSHTADTPFYVFYGNAGVTTDQSTPQQVWDTGFKGVFHFADKAADTVLKDSTTNAHNGVNLAHTVDRSVTGPLVGGTLGAAMSYNGTTDYADLGTTQDWDVTTGDATWEFWLRPDQLSTFGYVLNRGDWYQDGYFFRFGNQQVIPGEIELWQQSGPNTTGPLSYAPPFVNGVWYHFAFVKAATTGTLYLNGAAVASQTWWNPVSSTRHLYIARDEGNQYLAGISISELRLSSVARPAGWLQAEFVNQNSPGTFYSISPILEQYGVATRGASGSPIIF